MEDEPRSERPCTSKTEENVTNVRAVVKFDRHFTVRVVGSELNLNKQTVHDILTEQLGMRIVWCCMSTSPPVTLPSSWTNQKGYSSGSAAPYSPDLSPCDFFPFPKLKFHLKGRHFGTGDNIQEVTIEPLRALPHEEFQPCYRECKQPFRHSVASQGNYFEEDYVDF
jgi:hypothetical protein